jgi:hypothetical protein
MLQGIRWGRVVQSFAASSEMLWAFGLSQLFFVAPFSFFLNAIGLIIGVSDGWRLHGQKSSLES